MSYAKDRLQGRSLTGPKNPSGPADPLIVHPDVRRMLMTIRAFNEGARALSLWVGTHIDLHEKHPDAAVQKDADDFVALMTPIVKAYFTDMGFECANMAMQIYGGHGYIREYGMEQFVRDARIAQIYEGANGIQALDLVGRKLPAEGGRFLRFFFHPLSERLERTMQDPQLKEFAEPAVEDLRAAAAGNAVRDAEGARAIPTRLGRPAATTCGCSGLWRWATCGCGWPRWRRRSWRRAKGTGSSWRRR